MTIWYEVHCDINLDGCKSHHGDHPSGWSTKYARYEARRLGFKRVEGNDICRSCHAKQRENGS